MKTLKIAMLGFGNAGKALSKLILEKQNELINTIGWELKVVAIVTESKGNLVNENGIDLRKAQQDIYIKGHFDKNCSAYSQWSTNDILENVQYDVLIEITSLNIFSGQPAINHIYSAFNRNKHVITANKGPIAWAYKDLKNFAKKQGVLFFYETTVMDGTPIFNLVDETLPMCKIKEFKGILNTTTNFILGEMAKGINFRDAILEGQKRGFVEADPSLDLEGWDAAAKTAALMNVFMDCNITPPEIKREGIQNITYGDIVAAQKDGKVIKLICHGILENENVIGEVKPMKIERSNIFSNITRTSSIVTLKSDLMGEITIVEHDPEIEQTAYGLFSDLLRLLRKIQ